MSLAIHITKETIEAELKKEQAMVPGYHEFLITDVSTKAAKDNASMNYVTRFVIQDGSDRYIDHYFNSKPYGQTFIVKLFAALNNVTVIEFLEKLGKEFDLNFDNVKNRKVLGKVVHNIGDNGKIFNNLEDWAPLGKVPF